MTVLLEREAHERAEAVRSTAGANDDKRTLFLKLIISALTADDGGKQSWDNFLVLHFSSIEPSV